jgi:hypothetical protein
MRGPGYSAGFAVEHSQSGVAGAQRPPPCTRCATIFRERRLMQQIIYNLRFRWFLGLTIDNQIWDRSTITKNRDRLCWVGRWRGASSLRFWSKPIVRGFRRRSTFAAMACRSRRWPASRPIGRKTRMGRPVGGRHRSVDFHCEARSWDAHQPRTDTGALLFQDNVNVRGWA